MFDPITDYLTNNSMILNGLTIAHALIIDSSFIYAFYSYLRYTKLIDNVFGLISFYSFRALILNISQWPRPKKDIFYNPGFPSIFVIYTKTNDIYFSGHTGCMTVFFFIHLFRRLKK